MGFHVGTRWAPSGLSPVKILLFKFSVFENGLQMGPRWALPSGLDKGLGEGLNWGPFGLAHLKLSGVRMGWIWVSRWVQYRPKVGPAQEKYFDSYFMGYKMGSKWAHMDFAQWAAYGLGRGLKRGPI